MGKSNIGWTHSTWNPLRWNCTPVSPGCAHCYAHTLARRRPHLANEGDFLKAPALREAAWQEVKTLEPGTCFVCSMSDLFHPGVRQQWIHRIFNTFRTRQDILWLVLTKRIERAAALAPYLDWPPNLWIGASIENDDYTWRLYYLRQIPAAGRFVSFEPLLGSLKGIYLKGIDWVIVGGESGSNRRPFDPQWAREIRESCRLYGPAFFFKQGSAFAPGKDRLLDGRTWEEHPAAFERWIALRQAPTIEQGQSTIRQMSLFEAMP